MTKEELEEIRKADAEVNYQQKQYYWDHREKRLEYGARYRAKYREQIREAARLRRKDPEYRERERQQARERYWKKKQEKKNDDMPT